MAKNTLRNRNLSKERMLVSNPPLWLYHPMIEISMNYM